MNQQAASSSVSQSYTLSLPDMALPLFLFFLWGRSPITRLGRTSAHVIREYGRASRFSGAGKIPHPVPSPAIRNMRKRRGRGGTIGTWNKERGEEVSLPHYMPSQRSKGWVRGTAHAHAALHLYCTGRREGGAALVEFGSRDNLVILSVAALCSEGGTSSSSYLVRCSSIQSGRKEELGK